MRVRQLKLFSSKSDLSFGGILNKGKRKTARPLSQKKPIHIVLKANNPFLLLRNKKKIEQTIAKFNSRFGVKLYGMAVQDDHIHLNVVLPNRTLYKRWIRAITSVPTRQIEGLKWKLLPFSRIGSWGRDFKAVVQYIKGNAVESEFILAAHLQVEQWCTSHGPAD